MDGGTSFDIVRFKSSFIGPKLEMNRLKKHEIQVQSTWIHIQYH